MIYRFFGVDQDLKQTDAKTDRRSSNVSFSCVIVLERKGWIMAEKIKIENVVASTDIKKIISLDKLLNVLEASEYEPEQFPGLVYRLDEPRVATLIFRSGKIICVGARSTAAAKERTQLHRLTS